MESEFVQETIAVIGAGAFGTALAQVGGKKGHKINLYARSSVVVQSINEKHINPHYLSSFVLSENITATDSVEVALRDVSFIILAIPTQLVPNWLAENKHFISPKMLLCNTAKGLYLAQNCLLSEAINAALNREQPYTILSGPSFAKEIVMGQPTAVVVAGKYLYHAVHVQRALSSLQFRIYTTQDVIGVQLGL